MIALLAALVLLCMILNSATEGKLKFYWMLEIALLALLIGAEAGMK